jgi:hypothetical protein
MLQKIISGGQTGAERAALDAAIKLGIAHGGWISRNRVAEDGTIPERYDLIEMASTSLSESARKNVRESDGTLVFSHGSLSNYSDLARKMAQRYSSPVLHVDLSETIAFSAASLINDWIIDNVIKTLNVTGPSSSLDPRIYQATLDIIQAVYFLNLTEVNLSNPIYADKTVSDAPATNRSPDSVSEAVADIITEMPLKDRALMANMREEELAPLQLTLGLYIKKKLNIWIANEAFFASCTAAAEEERLDASNIPILIIRKIWKELRATHRLRLVK